ncbi:hypothetical protein MACK_002406 [Theileria orientalis]|uniref:Uncharacterized protein n=1 Tax=Theileria orientalis TaxID=68886 RepID=A0A976QVA4_THEOR|nr:hypothetical protein MACK_002406 [Theileria orientalis]
MGLSQSSVYLYLGFKDRSYGIEGNHKVFVRRDISKICKNFERVFFLIRYDKEPLRELLSRNPYYDITICTGTGDHNKGKSIFRYDSYSVEEIIKVACVYYSVLRPDLPLIVCFLTRQHKLYRCTYNKLETQAFVYSYNIRTLTFGGTVKKRLPEEYITRSRNKKLTFSLEIHNNKGVTKNSYGISTDNKFKKLIYTGSCDSCTVYYSDLFESSTQIDAKKLDCPKITDFKNFIDPYFLEPLKNNKLDGIIVYYTASRNKPENVAYLVEFIDLCEVKKQYVRKDKHSACWHKAELKYTNEKQLIKKLEEIKKDADSKDVTTYIIEKKATYLCVKVEKDKEPKKPNTHEGYAKYSHTPTTKRYKSNLVHNLQSIKLESKEFTREIVVMDSYFLKNSKKEEDDTPFLVVFNVKPLFPLDLSLIALKYIAKPCGKPEVWNEIPISDVILKQTLNKIDKIVKQKKIKEKSEPKSFKELREEACEILDKAIPPSVVPSKPVPPGVYPGEPGIPAEKYQLTTWQIIGITIGAIHLSCIVGGVSYIIYWYRTTIMLLT